MKAAIYSLNNFYEYLFFNGIQEIRATDYDLLGDSSYTVAQAVNTENRPAVMATSWYTPMNMATDNGMQQSRMMMAPRMTNRSLSKAQKNKKKGWW